MEKGQKEQEKHRNKTGKKEKKKGTKIRKLRKAWKNDNTSKYTRRKGTVVLFEETYFPLLRIREIASQERVLPACTTPFSSRREYPLDSQGGTATEKHKCTSEVLLAS